MPRKNPETKFKEKVLEDLKTIPNLWYVKTQEVSVRGIPDLLICYKGRFLAFELKVDSPPEELQIYTLTKIKQAGGISSLVTPKNWKMVFGIIKEIK